jgi:predicted DsbA family dithiol-disulfide isomerase
MKVEIWSDVMCPFCYIGKRKLEVALQQIDFSDSVEIVWKSYQLNPELETNPNSSIYHYLSEQKGMPMEQVRTMIIRVSEMAKEVGITMNFEQQVVANSFLAHRLSHLAKKWNVQHACEEALFLAHFTEGKNIDSEEVILEIGTNLGISESEIQALFESDIYSNDVIQDQYEAQNIRVRGVPHFVFNDKYVVSGAQDSSVFAGALRQSFEEWKDAQTGFSSSENSCDLDENCN